MSDNILKTKQCCIAFIDIIGSKTLIEDDKEGKYLNIINDAYNFALSLKDSNNLICEKNTQDLIHIETKIFSDNILISTEIKDNVSAVKSFFQISSFVQAFQRYLLKSGLLVRGGITFGDLYMDDVFAWGEGLVSAYHLESDKNCAKYPRIIVDNKIMDLIKNIIYPTDEMLLFMRIKQDDDGWYFLNYLDYSEDPFVVKITEDSIEENEMNIKLYFQKTDVVEKLLWQRKYLNQSKKNESKKAD